MNILVINGSPKGQNSITLQTTNYLKIDGIILLKKRYPHENRIKQYLKKVIQ